MLPRHIRPTRPQAIGLVVLISLLGSGVNRASELVRSEQELKQLQDNIRQLDARLAAERGNAQSLTAELDAIERQITGLQRQIRQGQTEVGRLQAEQPTLAAQSQALRDQLGQSRRNLMALARSSYMLGREGGLKLLLNQRDPIQASRYLSMYHYVIEARDRQLQQIQQQQRLLAENRAALQAKTAHIQTHLAQLEADQQALKQAEQNRRQALQTVQEQLLAGEKQVVLYKQREQELNRLLANLKRAARSATATNRSAKASEQSPTAAQSLELSGFRQHKGQLLLPLKAATIVARFGQRRRDSGLKWQGLMLQGQAHQAVTAIYFGQVVFSDWFRGYGQLLVLDHGDGYMSLYAHNSQLLVDLGDYVHTGQVIAKTGRSDGLQQVGLYFEIRYNGHPDDPLLWCRI